MKQTLLLTALALCLLTPSASPRPAQDSGTRPSAFFNTHLHAKGGPWAAGDWVAFLVPEEDRDLNGDGNTNDSVLHIVDVRTLQVINLGLAVDPLLAGRDVGPPVAFSASTLAVLVSERAQGNKDLNGDGDATDDVLEIVDLTTRKVTNTDLAGSEVRMDGSRVALLTPEAEQGKKDLNGDG